MKDMKKRLPTFLQKQETPFHYKWWWKLWVKIEPAVNVAVYVFTVLLIFGLAYAAMFL